MENSALINELTNTPYNGLTAAQCATKLNTDTRAQPVTSLSTEIVRRTIVAADLLALTQLQLAQLNFLLASDYVNPSDQNVVDGFAGVLTGKNSSLTALAALKTKSVTVAVYIGWGGFDNPTLAEYITKITGRA